jgi:hypothetical protein
LRRINHVLVMQAREQTTIQALSQAKPSQAKPSQAKPSYVIVPLRAVVGFCKIVGTENWQIVGGRDNP